MPVFNIFLIIGLVALLISFFTGGKSAIWGGATLGLIIGVIIGIIKGDFSDILRVALVGANMGLFANILSWLGTRLRG